jgi:hypothetical protein
VLRTNAAIQTGNNDMEAAVFGRFKHKNKTNNEEIKLSDNGNENTSDTLKMQEMNNKRVYVF